MPGKPKPSAGVDSYMQRTEQLRIANERVAELAKIDNITRWSQSGKKAILSASLSRSAAAAQEELVHLNHELKTRRRAKLREFYEECEEKYEKELNEKGLAFVKARV